VLFAGTEREKLKKFAGKHPQAAVYWYDGINEQVAV